MRSLAVAVIADTRSSYVRGVLRGILRFAREQGTWTLGIAPPDPAPRALLKQRHWDGCIALIVNTQLQTLLARGKRVCVNVSHSLPLVCCPSVYSDDIVVGRRGAQFLLGLGLRSLAFCGLSERAHSDDRQKGFCDVAAAEGVSCTAWSPPARTRLPEKDRQGAR